jgi:hypothetical protein
MGRRSGRQALALLRRAGFVVDRTVGSHHVSVHPGDGLGRFPDDESAVKVSREKSRLSQRALMEHPDIHPVYLDEIQTGSKPGTADALRNQQDV